MLDSVTHLLERFLSGGRLTRDEILYGILLIGLVIATLQIVVMLVTRWGDRNPTSKALIFSVVVHLSTIFGVVAWQPELITKSDTPKEDQPDAVMIRELDVISETELVALESGNTPVWERLPEARPLDFNRQAAPEATPLPLSDPTRDSVDTRLSLNTRTLNSLPDWAPSPQATPGRSEDADTSRDGANLPLDIDVPEMYQQPDLGAPINTPTRRKVEREGDATPEVDRQAIAGSADRLFKRVDPTESLASLSPEVDPRAMIRRGTDDERASRTAPDFVPDIEESAGVNTTDPGKSLGEELPTRSAMVRRRPGGRRTPVDRLSPERSDREPLDATRDRTDDLIASRTPSFDTPDVAPVPVPSPTPRRSSSDEPREVRTDDAPALPPLYVRRQADTRLDTARKNGGTRASEKAVEDALAWLASAQEENGSWDASKHQSGQVGVDTEGVNRRFAGRQADNGVTGLAILAFLGAGYTHEDGRYQGVVQKAIKYLVDDQEADGFLGGDATHYGRMYCHGIATYALAEAYGMSTPQGGKTWIRFPLEKAVAYTLDMQGDDGAWRYVRGQQGDMSMFGWQLMALRSAQLSGLAVPKEANEKMIKFLNTLGRGEHGGLAPYRDGEEVTAPMTAEGLFCKQMFRIPRDHAASKEAVAYLMDHLPRRSELNLYYWYYGTLAMFQYGGEEWTRWNNSFRDVLIAEQVKNGPLAGSYNPTGPWGPYGGRVYSTAIATLCLEAYYRFLPLYRIGEKKP